MQSLKELIEGAFFHSWQRTGMVLGGLILALALPITIILTQQQQDIRQEAFYQQVKCESYGGCGGGMVWGQVPGTNNCGCYYPDWAEGGKEGAAPGTLGGTCVPGSAIPCSSGSCNCQWDGCFCTTTFVGVDKESGKEQYSGSACKPGNVGIDCPGGECIYQFGIFMCTYPPKEVKKTCTDNVICGTCTAPPNTCGTANGTISCSYTSHPTAGTNCTPAVAPSQTCGIDNCTSPNTCVNGTCTAPIGAAAGTNPSPSLTQTPADETLIALTVSLPGIGSNAPVEGQGPLNNNENPKRTTREVEILLGNSAGENVTSLASGSTDPVSGTLTFDTTSFTYKGVISLKTLPTGNYKVFIRFDNTLYKATTGFPLITLDQTTAIPSLEPNVGDIDRGEGSDNEMSLDDYNLFIACFKEKETCTPQAKIRADLDDNGTIDTIDLHLMQKGFANREGDSPI